ncbi:MAG: hypothetical protein J5X22_17090 [Candidatus Accumulibacter sp.]|uniref:hypothetical protein n=1 Tax=Accumulibacter sp. TaxID=2053492 RepID=UPI001AC5E94A|nr:hypothetical protein [Accumulibacter sp.]MBN8519995.1 hypothetical protein [Accumulibacter sp.]MBO3712136.1 hypothetical protein [Accumulibacter sp.]
MNTRCKPGDLAIIIYDVPGCEENIGRVVHVSGPPAIDYKGQLTWLIMPVDTTEPYVIDNPFDGTFRYMGYLESGIEHPDDWILPIRQEREPEEVTAKEIEGIEA